MRHGRLSRAPLVSQYNVDWENEGFVCIRDIGHETSMSVTNDAERVVRELTERGLLGRNGVGKRRLLYVDSTGRLDEILHDGCGAFQGFGPAPEGIRA